VIHRGHENHEATGQGKYGWSPGGPLVPMGDFDICTRISWPSVMRSSMGQSVVLADFQLGGGGHLFFFLRQTRRCLHLHRHHFPAQTAGLVPPWYHPGYHPRRERPPGFKSNVNKGGLHARQYPLNPSFVNITCDGKDS